MALVAITVREISKPSRKPITDRNLAAAMSLISSTNPSELLSVAELGVCGVAPGYSTSIRRTGESIDGDTDVFSQKPFSAHFHTELPAPPKCTSVTFAP